MERRTFFYTKRYFWFFFPPSQFTYIIFWFYNTVLDLHFVFKLIFKFYSTWFLIYAISLFDIKFYLLNELCTHENQFSIRILHWKLYLLRLLASCCDFAQVCVVSEQLRPRYGYRKQGLCQYMCVGVVNHVFVPSRIETIVRLYVHWVCD